jgi:uncharacterized protein
VIHGAGIGLRSCHYSTILENKPAVPWFEVLSDNYMVQGGAALAYLDAICERYPVVLHGVGLSLGSTDELSADYLARLKTLVDRVNPAWVSDHLCWSSVNGQHFHDLLPLPYTEEVVQHVADRIKRTQDVLDKPVLIENVSSYLQYKHSDMAEWDFINAVAERAGCFILLDVNNVYVSSVNHSFDPTTYVKSISPSRVKQIHLAGYEDKGCYLFDNHGDKVQQPVWDLYQTALERIGPVPTLVEWDDRVPDFSVLQAEAHKAQAMINKIGSMEDVAKETAE